MCGIKLLTEAAEALAGLVVEFSVKRWRVIVKLFWVIRVNYTSNSNVKLYI